MEELTDIITACKDLDTSSRTLRYYEEIGLIKSIRLSSSSLRHYNHAQLEKLRKILFLRQLGLSLDDIKVIINAGEKTNTVLKTKYAYLYAELERINRRLRLIEEVISVANANGDIYAIDINAPFEEQKNIFTDMADRCTELLLQGKFEEITVYYDDNLKVYLPFEALKKAWIDTTSACGQFLRRGRTELDGNIVSQYLVFEKVGIMVKYVFNNSQLSGFWLSYYMEEKEK